MPSVEIFLSLLLSGGLTYWGREAVPQPPFKMENQKPFLLPRLPYKYDAENIEATAYALLTYVARQELFVDPIVKWLNSQRLYDGGWASTQVSQICLSTKNVHFNLCILVYRIRLLP